MCNRLIKTGLKSRMLRRVSQFKMYKELFNNIEEEWEQSYFMEDDFAGKERNNHRQPCGSGNDGGSKRGVPQIRQVPCTSWILDTWTQTAKLHSPIQGRPRKPEIINTPIQQPQAPVHGPISPVPLSTTHPSV